MIRLEHVTKRFGTKEALKDITLTINEGETLAIIGENKGASRKTAVILRNFLEDFEQGENAGKVRTTERVENFRTYVADLMRRRHADGFCLRVVMGTLYSFSLIYRQLVNLKLWGYKAGLFKRKHLSCYVISLGNITVGGTGKTPTAQHLARAIHAMGYRVVILNRGYRAKWRGEVGIVSDGRTLKMDAETAGDEAFMLAKHLPNVPVLIGAQRAVTGRYAIEHFGALPDIMTVAKALGNGAPISAFIATPEVADTYTKPGASTLGGNPVSTTAGLEVIRYIEEHDLIGNAERRGAQLRAGLREIQKRHPIIGDVRGLGLMVGAEFVHADKSPAAAELDMVLEELKNRGFIVGKNGIGRNVMAFQPPLIITEDNISDVLNALELVLTEKGL